MLENGARHNRLMFGRFQVMATYKGGMARVFVLQDVLNNRIVAAKTPSGAYQDFSREARLWLGLGSHPNIVRGHLVHADHARPYLIMDFVGDLDGRPRTLRRALNESGDTVSLLLSTGIAVVRALTHARTIFPGFVHRDLKPENILVDSNFNVLVSDFGIGHIPRRNVDDNVVLAGKPNGDEMVRGSTRFTRAGSFVGTIGYAAPEQYSDSSTVTYKADIFALGAVIYEGLTRRLPYFPGYNADGEIQFTADPLNNFIRLEGKAQTRLWAYVTRMLSLVPSERQESLTEIEEEFLELQQFHCPREYQRESINPPRSELTQVVLLNRAHSLIELREPNLALSVLSDYQKKRPISPTTTALVRRLFQSAAPKSKWNFFKEVAQRDFSNPTRAAWLVLLLAVCIGSTYGAACLSGMSLLGSTMSCVLLFILLCENYINSRTMITSDLITINGTAVGVAISGIAQILGHHSLAGSIWKSLAGALLGLALPYMLAVIARRVAGKAWIGGGTIKLSAMVGSWTGLLILPIMIVVVLILALQFFFVWIFSKLPGELTWAGDTLRPRLHRRVGLTIPTSSALLVSTWLVLTVRALCALKI